MIEQLVSLNTSQAGIDLTNNPMAANTNDVMKFNLALKDQKVDNHALLDVKTDNKINNGFLQIQKSEETNPIIKMDQSYKAILNQMKETSQFDKFLEIRKDDKAPIFRSNITMIEKKPDVKEDMQRLLDETKEMYKVSGEITKDISEWTMKTTIWTTNVKVLLGVVKQTSSAFKALFHSAG
jgi:hypothetical protein